ncbi:MAG TPA: hypothetical protein VHS06_03740 [Chloroflexota bacterium]|nr:hypothetical protein [Chloroflexota bacterium]
MRLPDALLECTLPLLRKIALNHSLPVGDDTLRPELAGQLAEMLSKPGYLERCVERLDEGERRILGEVAGSRWCAKAFVIDRLSPRKGGTTSSSKREPLSPCLSLLQKGLLYRGFGIIGDWRGELYYVPDEMQSAFAPLAARSTKEAAPDVRSASVPPSVEEHSASFDLFCLLSYLRRQHCRLRGDRLARSDAERLDVECGRRTEVWSAGRAEDRWGFLLQLCLSLGWVHREGHSLTLSQTAFRALAGDVTSVRTRLIESYLANRFWSDLEAAGRVRQLLGGRRIDEASARKVALHYLDTLCGENWCDDAAFCEAVRSTNPDFLREDYSSPGWAVIDTRSGIELSGEGSWNAVEGEWLRYLLLGPLFWLGFVRWGTSPGGLPIAFQFCGTPQQVVTESAAIQESGEELRVTAPAQCDTTRLFQLERYAELQKRAGSSSYRLGRDTVLSAMESGGSREELVRLLRDLSGDEIDGVLLARASGWASDYGRFTLEAATLLTAENTEDSVWAESLPGVASWLGERAGGTSQKVIPEHLWDIVEALKRANQLPRVDPSLRRQGLRRIAADTELFREALFALLLVRAIQPGGQWGDAAAAIRKIESALGPEEAAKVRARVEDVTRQGDGVRGMARRDR